jgi:hypothetical protein
MRERSRPLFFFCISNSVYKSNSFGLHSALQTMTPALQNDLPVSTLGLLALTFDSFALPPADGLSYFWPQMRRHPIIGRADPFNFFSRRRNVIFMLFAARLLYPLKIVRSDAVYAFCARAQIPTPTAQARAEDRRPGL